MAATFDPSLASDEDWIRLWVGDTNTANAAIDDDTLTALLAANGGSVNLATVAAFNVLIALLSQPDYKADWLAESFGDAVDNMRKRRDSFIEENSLASDTYFTASSVAVYRSDSDMTTALDGTDIE